MKDILFLMGLIIGSYVLIQVMQKKPIMPFIKSKRIMKEKGVRQKTASSKAAEKEDLLKEWEEEIALPFKELFPEILAFDEHMIMSEDDKFTMVAEVTPTNYFLLDEMEQQQVDNNFETWIAQIDYPVRIYFQQRYVDLTEEIEMIKETMNDQENLYHKLEDYGNIMIQNLMNWQRERPRYETKRYLIFSTTIASNTIKAESDEELDQIMFEKAFTELHRRVLAAKQQLRKSGNEVELLTTEGIAEVLYYGFNRKKALKNRFKDIEKKEKMATFITADKTVEQIIAVKSELDEAAALSTEKADNLEEKMMANRQMRKEGNYEEII